MWGMGNGKCEGEGGAGGSRAMGCVLGGLQAARMGADGTGCEVIDLLAFQTALSGLLDDASYTHISVKNAVPRKLIPPPIHPPWLQNHHPAEPPFPLQCEVKDDSQLGTKMAQTYVWLVRGGAWDQYGCGAAWPARVWGCMGVGLHGWGAAWGS